MPFGTLSVGQQAIVKSLVQGREVHDLGAGDLALSRLLVGLGASSVIAVDKEPLTAKLPKGVQYRQRYFSELTDKVDIAFLSWPANHELGLVPLLRRTSTVIYLGKNSDLSSCGYLDMWKHFSTRGLLHYLPESRNTLIVYEGYLRQPRKLRGEELAALSQWEEPHQEPWSYLKTESFQI